MSTYKLVKLEKNKTPESDLRHVGIEIEFISEYSEDDIKEAFCDADLEEYVTYHEDGSVGDKDDCTGYCHDGCDDDCSDCHCTRRNGHEICVLARESNYRSVIRQVCKVLDKMNAEVNSTCGLHVHIDMRSRNRSQVYSNLFNTLPLLNRLVPESRIRNSYCKTNEESDFLDHHASDDRYYAINTRSLDRHKTFEVRLHSGTTNPIKIINWITLLLRIVQSKPIDRAVKTVQALRQYTRVSTTLAKYLQMRITKFDPNTDEFSEIEETAIPEYGQAGRELPLAA